MCVYMSTPFGPLGRDGPMAALEKGPLPAVPMYIYIYMYTYIRTYIYIYIHIHTYIYIYIYTYSDLSL